MYEMTLVLRGLSCPSCAGKIERDVKKMNDIKETSLNFTRQELYLKYENLSKHSLMEKIRDIANDYESNISVTEKSYFSSIYADDTNVSIDRHADSEQRDGDKPIQAVSGFIKNHKFALRFLTSGLLFSFGYLMNSSSSIWLYVLAYLVLGVDVLYRAFKNIVKGDFLDENFLMSAATIGAFILGQYPEAIAVMLFFQIGGYFEERAVDKSRRSIEESMNIKPEYANFIFSSLSAAESNYSFSADYIRKFPAEISVGDVILIKPGEKVPLDGEILMGDSQLDTSSLTGESVPANVSVGDYILSGSINISGTLILKVMKSYENSTVARILELIENASSKKARTERFITRFSKIYTPCVVFGAIALSLIPPMFSYLTGGGCTFSVWIPRALVFLVTSCPCALVVSVPLTFYSGIGACSKKGVLIKGSNYLQILSELDTVVFDKTGTLTKGSFEVTEIMPATQAKISEKGLLELAYIMEKASNHPVAKSIVNAYSKLEEPIAAYEIAQFTEKGGLGLSAIVNGETVLIGNDRLMNTENITFEKHSGDSTALYVAKSGSYLGRISVADKIKETSKQAISLLKKNASVVMLTGDRDETARKIASELGIDRVYSQLLPDQKVEMIEKIYDGGAKKVAFTGDGINDAPVLARADVGIAMGGVGSDAAIEAADVVIMNDDPLKIVDAITAAKNTMRLVKQNIVFALSIKFIVLGLAAFGIGTMWMAVFADVGVELIVILNSIRKK